MTRSALGGFSVVVLLAGVAGADIDYWRYLSSPGFVRAIAVDPTNPAVLYAALSNAATYYGDHGTPFGAGVWRSTDGGHGWVPRNGGLTNLHVTSLAIDPSAPSTLYAGTEGGGLFKTTDAGLVWTAQNAGLGTLDVYAIAVDPQAPARLYAGLANGGVYRSTDGGATWNATAGTGNVTVWQIAIDPSTPSTLYAATDAGVRKSVDAGATWSVTGPMTVQEPGQPVQRIFEVHAVLVDASAPSTVFAGAHEGGGVFASTDGGTTWAHASTGLRSRFGNWRFINVLAQDTVVPSTLYASSTVSTYRSIDGGATWVVFEAGMSRGEAYALAPTSAGGAFIASSFGDVHALTVKPSGVDAFRCFKARARNFAPRVVTVTDRFGTQQLTLLKASRFCTPTSPGGEPIADATTHLACYKVIPGAFPTTNVEFLSQRLDGYRAYQVNREDTLCVPAAVAGVPSARPRDAYRCLGGPRWSSDPLDFVLADGLGTQPVRKTRLDRLCVATDVDGGGRLEPGIDLRCDKLLGGASRPVPSAVTVEDRFGSLALELQKADSHCVPALESRS